jgi:hypothetical protein
MQERTGGCQCGRVRYRVTGQPIAVSVCHCKECQRQSGSAFGMSMIVEAEHFHVETGTLKEFERSSESGRSVRCAFCPECGTRIYHVPSYIENVINVKPGTLDDTSGLQPTRQIWVQSAQKWVPLRDDITTSPKQPF